MKKILGIVIILAILAGLGAIVASNFIKNPTCPVIKFIQDWRAKNPESTSTSEGLNLPDLKAPELTDIFAPIKLPSMGFSKDEAGFKKFASEEDFKDYLKKNSLSGGMAYGRGGGMEIMTAVSESAPMAKNMASDAVIDPARVSQTNVQVVGIDEPDIIKTNGKTIFYSAENMYWGRPMPLMMEKVSSSIMPRYEEPKVSVINALPLKDLSFLSEIEKSGEMLLKGDTLMVFHYEGIYAYNVANPSKPEKLWNIKYKSGTWLDSARLMGDKIYFVTKTGVNSYKPCPIVPLEANGKDISIACANVYYPQRPISGDTTFNAFSADVKTGEVSAPISFLGANGESAVYMSNDYLYVTFSHFADSAQVFLSFFEKEARDLVPSSLISKIKKLSEYDLSQQAKNVEIQNLWEGFAQSLSGDDRLKLENDLNNKFADYYKKNFRAFEGTSIAKIGLKDFKLSAQGEVAGHPLNQWCLDEYQGNLRIATTVGGRWNGLWLSMINIPMDQTANDIYVLDGGLKTLGHVFDLGLTERIYSARFIGNKGYLVTFRQTDPFYVLDLSNPALPKVTGELKIPGYSGYLHPIGNNLILGVGQENWQTKLSLFDVSDAKNPKELDKYLLKDGWSEAMNNHHAFLMDEKHEVFFLPANNGYVFSYTDNKLTLKKAVSDIYARRAIYINDYLYIFHNKGITVLDEKTWEKAKELSF